MITLDRRVAPGTFAGTTLTLAYEARRQGRQKVRLDNGEEADVLLAWGETLKQGDLIASTSGLVVRVLAAPEAVMLVHCSHLRELARVAYHLGNRGVPVEIGDGVLKLAPDPVLRALVEGLGAQVELATLSFEPETIAYGGHGHGSSLASRSTGAKQVS